MATAKHRAIDVLRRNDAARAQARGTRSRDRRAASGRRADLDAALDDDIGDDLLRLVFIACHPVLSTDARVALTLRLLGGLTTDEIARAFLVPEPTIAQRIVRAKRTLVGSRACRSRCRAGRTAPRAWRRCSKCIYLIFNEGYSATAGDDWMRPALCEDALRLGRILAELVPQEPEVHGLVALMEIQASRIASARRPVRRADPVARAGPRALGSAADPSRPRSARARGAARRRARAVRAAGRDRRLSRARAHGRRRPTGRGSRRCTTRSRNSRRRRSSSSTAPSRSRWRSVPPPASSWSMR